MKTFELINSPAVLPESTHLGRVSMVVRDLKRSVEFYSKVLKMTLHQQDKDIAILGNAEHALLELRQDATAKSYPQSTGLYHFAIIYPAERELAEAVAWLFELGVNNSPTDHGYSKTTYLVDPDGTTIELYIRTPERAIYIEDDSGAMVVKYADGRLGNGRDPLDLDELFRTIGKDSKIDAPLSAETAMGHVHLFAHNIEEMMLFYRDIIGLGEGMMLRGFQMGDAALSEAQFHVIAFNQWKGDVLPPPDRNIGMHHYTLVVPDDKAHSSLETQIKKAGIATTLHQGGYFIKDPAGLRLYITQDDANVKFVAPPY